MSIIKTILFRPASLLYSLATKLRNKLYDLNILHSSDTPITSISVGNITVGGTGKTPHTEYLIDLLSTHTPTAYLSRGYRRHSKGFVMANAATTAAEIGDEAYQIHTKYPEIVVAVDENRQHGIKLIKKAKPLTSLVLLDDCYQHRAVHPDLNILLIDYNRLIYNDKPLPYGTLRESAKNTDRADIIIITKCPVNLLPVDMLSIRVQISPYPYQNLYFTTLRHLPPKSIIGNSITDLTNYELLVVTGIDQPTHLHQHLKRYTTNIQTLTFPDHHPFSAKDIKTISNRFDQLQTDNRAIITTEKDLARIDLNTIPEILKPHIYTIGIEIDFLFEMKDKFDTEITKFATLRCKPNQ